MDFAKCSQYVYHYDKGPSCFPALAGIECLAKMEYQRLQSLLSELIPPVSPRLGTTSPALDKINVQGHEPIR